MKTVIMAGGKGTRIASVFSDVPKPMVELDGKPVLEYEIECLRRQGFTDIILTVGHMADVIISHFGDGSRFGVHITYYRELQPLGTAGALYKIRGQLTEDFLLLSADTMFNVDFNRLIAKHREMGKLATLFTHPNSHPYDSGLLVTDAGGTVQQWLTKEDARPQWYQNRVNAGIHVLKPEVLDRLSIRPEDVGEPGADGRPVKVDLDRQLLRPLAGTGELYCYDSPEYVKDMGTPERYESVRRDLEAGIIERKNLMHRQKAVFLDRDGTINRYVGFLTDIDDFELLPGAAEAVRRINASGYLAIVVTNQPVVARGEVTRSQLEMIHNKMETLLGREGAYLDAVYYCPHHPDGGYPGEVKELKISCDCRKPKPGMLLKAAREYHIDLAQSWMVGDAATDVQTGINAGCRTALIGKGECRQDATVADLLDFTRRCLD